MIDIQTLSLIDDRLRTILPATSDLSFGGGLMSCFAGTSFNFYL
jgi:hypothetical protein